MMKIQLKNIAVIVGTVLSCAVISAPAFADDASFATGGYARAMHTIAQMKMLDADGNHMVTQKEFTDYYTTVFNDLDTDKDGSLDAKEWVGTKGANKISLATGGYSRELRKMSTMKAMDTDSDHTVTKDEFLAFQQTAFDAMDKNGDKQIDPQEWLAKQTGN